jgi:hypothetical protein
LKLFFNARLNARRSSVVSLLDQAASSLTNFGSVVFAAVALSATEFGEYSLAYISYTIILGAFQSLIGHELVLVGGSDQRIRAASNSALSFAFWLALIPSLAILIVVWAFPVWGSAMLPLAVLLPVLMLQDTLRFAAAVQKRMHVSLLVDMSWLLLLGAGVVAMNFGLLGLPSAFSMALVWSSAGALSVVPGLLALHLSPEGLVPDQALSGVSRYWARGFLGHRFFAEFVAIRGTSQTLQLAIGWLAGLVAAGALRGVITLFGPLNVLLNAMTAFGIPILKPLPARARDRWVIKLSVVTCAIAALVTLVLYLLPTALGRLILGETWLGAHALVLPIGAQLMALSVGTVVFMALRIEAPKSTLKVNLFTSIFVIAFFMAGYWISGVGGAAWGLFASSLLQTVVGALTYMRARGMFSRTRSPRNEWTDLVCADDGPSRH